MALALITPPAELPVTLAELKAELRIDPDDDADDARIMGYLASALGQIDGSGGTLRRQLITATWDYATPQFPCFEIKLPLGWLQSVTSVKYLDSAGVEQTLDPSAYQILNGDMALVFPAPGQRWPATHRSPRAVMIRYVVGYGDHNAVPEPIRHALLLMVAGAYDGCESKAAEALLHQWRYWY